MSKDASSYTENSAKTARRGNPSESFPINGERDARARILVAGPRRLHCRRPAARCWRSPFLATPKAVTYAERIALVLAEKAADGDIRAAQELAHRAEGRARQAILGEAFERMNTEELETYAVSGSLPEWFPKDDESIQ